MGVVKLGLEFTARYIGGDWVLDGEMVSSISRSETVTIQVSPFQKTTNAESLPPEVALIDDEPTGSRHFRWVARPGFPLELNGPLGTQFRVEVVPHN